MFLGRNEPKAFATYQSDVLCLQFKKKAGKVFAEKVYTEGFSVHYELDSSSFLQLKKILPLKCIGSKTKAINWLLTHNYAPSILEGKIVFLESTIEKIGADQIAQYCDSTPFHLTAEKGDVESAKQLIQSEANLNVCNKDNALPFDLAVSNNQDDYLHFFLGTINRLKIEFSHSTDTEGYYVKCLLEARQQNLVEEQIVFLQKISHFYLQKENYIVAAKILNCALALLLKLDQKIPSISFYKSYLICRLELIDKLFLKTLGIEISLERLHKIESYRNFLHKTRATSREAILYNKANEEERQKEHIQKMKKKAAFSVAYEDIASARFQGPTSPENQQAVIKEFQRIYTELQFDYEGIQQTLGQITKKFKELLKVLIMDAIALFGPPPMKWACLAMGSMSRGEMCPYSDVEFAFLIQKNDLEVINYFRNLSRFLELRIINLGETKFPIFGEKYESPTPDGFCMDVGGNTPLGVTGIYELIGTPRKLADFQDNNWLDKRGVILPNAMSNVCFVAGNEELFVEYNQEKDRVQERIAKSHDNRSANCELLALTLLQGHLEEFRPNLSKEKEIETAFGVKKELYRPFQEILSSLALFYRLKSTNTFDRIDELNQLQVLSPEGSRRLKEAFGKVLTLRLQVHLFYEDEKEFLCHPSEPDLQDPSLLYMNEYHIKFLQEIYQVLMPFHRCATVFYDTKNKRSLNSSGFFEESPSMKGKSFEKLLDYGKAVEALQQAVSLNPNDVVAMSDLGNVQITLRNREEALSRSLKALELEKQKNGDIHVNLGVCYNNVGSVYDTFGGEPQKALDYYKKGLEILLQIFGEMHPEVAATYNNICSAYCNLSEYTLALEYFKKALGILLSTYGEMHPDVAVSYVHAGKIYYRLGESEKALKSLEKALKIRLQILSEDDPKLASVYNLKGAAFNRLGNHTQALECFNKALTIDLKIFGPLHPDIAENYNNIAGVHCDLKEYQFALEYYKKALVISKKAHDNFHVEVAMICNNMGNVYHALKKYPETLQFYQEALQIRNKVLHESHPSVAESYNNVGLALWALKKRQEALEYFEKKLELNKNLLGEIHEKVAKDYSSISHYYRELGKYEEALKYGKNGLEIRIKLFGENHLDVAKSYAQVGYIHETFGHLVEALTCYEASIAIELDLLEEDHARIATNYNNIAHVCLYLTRFEQALDYFKKYLPTQLKILEEDDTTIGEIFMNIGLCHEKLLQLDLSLEFHFKALAILQKRLGESHPTVAISYSNIGTAHRVSGKNEEALQYHQKALNIRLKLFGNLNTSVALSYYQLGLINENLKNYEKAIEFHEYSLQIRMKLLRAHPETVMSFNQLGVIYTSLNKYEKAIGFYANAFSISCSVYGDTQVTLTALSEFLNCAKNISPLPMDVLQNFQVFCEKNFGLEHEFTQRLTAATKRS